MATRKKPERKALFLRLPADLHSRLQEAAAEERRSLTQEIIRRLEQGFEAPVGVFGQTGEPSIGLWGEKTAEIDKHLRAIDRVLKDVRKPAKHEKDKAKG